MTLKVTKDVEIRKDLGEAALAHILEDVPIDYDLDIYYEDLDDASKRVRFLEELKYQFEEALLGHLIAGG